MKRFTKPALALTLAITMGIGFTSCSNDDDNDGIENMYEVRETAFKNAATPYVNNTVYPTYEAMADAAILLYDKCTDIQAKYAAGTLTENDIEQAGNYWKASRKSWELSEAFLFGPAAQHNIDPHIDSWPLDKNAMDVALNDIRNGKEWSIDNNGGYGLIGFHSVEYILFELTSDGNQSRPHDPATYTPEILEFLVTVTEDLRNQCILLEACWKGMDNISKEKQDILEEAELDYAEEYGWEMINAGIGGSRFKTYQSVAEEIIQGCIDIIDEVGNTKIGKPHGAASEEDRNYIESPYSLNSVEDFQDNIRSVQNSYIGSKSGDASISDYVKSIDPKLDNDVRTAMENTITVIGRIPEPFTKTARGTEAAAAIDACNDLNDLMEEVMNVITGRK